MHSMRSLAPIEVFETNKKGNIFLKNSFNLNDNSSCALIIFENDPNC